MKRLIAIGLFCVAGAAYAGLIGSTMDSAATQGWQKKETKKYKLDVYGFDARAYEFNTENGMRCVMVFPGGDAKGWQMQCHPGVK